MVGVVDCWYDDVFFYFFFCKFGCVDFNFNLVFLFIVVFLFCEEFGVVVGVGEGVVDVLVDCLVNFWYFGGSVDVFYLGFYDIYFYFNVLGVKVGKEKLEI